MKKNSFSRKRIIHICVIAAIVAVVILIAIFLMFRYNVEGETNLPFNLKSINIVSTAESSLNKNEEVWHASILQKNDIFFTIEKNNNYKKQDAIKRVSFENFEITKENEDMIVTIYRPATSVNSYIYSDEYKIENSIEFTGSQSTNMETLQINNQGGIIGFSITSDNLGEYIASINEKVPMDGKLLAKAGVKKEEMDFKVSFDLIIETESNHKFKSNIVLDLPTGNILKDGVGTLEDTELKNIIFKRF